MIKDVGFLREIIDKLDEGVLIFNSFSQICLLNQTACQIMGLSAAETYGKKIGDTGWTVSSPSGRILSIKELEEAISPNVKSEKNSVVLHFDNQEGGKRVLKVSTGVLEYAEGYTMVTFQDLTEKYALEHQLKATESIFSTAFEYSAIGIALVSLEGRWLKVNQAVCQLLGYSKDELFMRNFQELTYPEDLETDLENVGKMISGELASYQMEKRFMRKDGTIVWVMLSVSMIKEAGMPAFFVSQLTDITAGKKMQEEMQHLDAEKTKILSILSHDIRTPLSSIQNYLELLSEEDLDEEERQYFEKNLLSVTRHTREILTNLLSWSKAQLDGFTISPVPLNLAETLSETLRVLSIIAVKKDIEVIANIDPSLQVVADRDMLQLIVRNLINNAIKFTPSGGYIHVFSNHYDRQCTITIRDTGIGISPQKQQELFSLKTRSTYGTHNEKGIGLGLVICKDFAELQSGSISLESEPGKGTSVHLTLPLK